MDKGQVIDSRFKIVKSIGAGGQGEVFLVEDVVEKNVERALKTLRPEFLPQDLARIKQEVGVVRTIDSDRVISIVATNLDEYEDGSASLPYFVMELAKRGTLNQHDYFRGEIELSLRLFRKICEGVSEIHKKGIIHRDLKPSNILLVKDEKDCRVGDFGICYIDLEGDEKRATRIREKVGPMHFAAPEQTSLPPFFSVRSDIYSLGRVLHFLITGAYEYTPGSDYVPVSVHLGLKQSTKVDDLIKRLISFDPKARPESIEVVLLEVDKLLGVKQTVPLQLTKMHKRILKYIQSEKYGSVKIEDILDYVSNFYEIRRGSESPFANFGIGSVQPGYRWAEFARMVETPLDQLEEAGILKFERGEYSSLKEIDLSTLTER